MTEKKKLDLSKLGITLPGDVLEHARAAVGSLSFMKELKEMRAMAQPSYLQNLRDQTQWAQAVVDLPQLTALQSLKPVIDFSHLANFQTQLEPLRTVLDMPHLTSLGSQVASLHSVLDFSYLTKFHEQLGILSAIALPEIGSALGRGNMPGAGLQAELAATLSSYQELLDSSALASFLVAPSDTTSSSEQVDIEGSATIQVAASGDLRVVPADSVDMAIIQAIEKGDAASLPDPESQRLQSVLRQIVVIWDMLLRLFNTAMALVYLTALMSSTSVPAEIPKQAEQLSNEQRVLLADYRMVNRNNARLRAEPSKAGEVIVKLGLGLPVEVLEYNGKGWYRVVAEYQDEWVEGWIHLTVTTKVPPPRRIQL